MLPQGCAAQEELIPVHGVRDPCVNSSARWQDMDSLPECYRGNMDRCRR